MLVSGTVNRTIVYSATRILRWFSGKPVFIRVQKWVMAGILSGLAVRMALDKGK